MANNTIRFLGLLIFLITSSYSCSKNIVLESPDGKISFIISTASGSSGKSIFTFSLAYGKKDILLPSSFNFSLRGVDLNGKSKILKTETETISNNWINKFGAKKEIRDNYNQLKIFLESNGLKINLIGRAYNEGIAFIYEFPQQQDIDSLTITDEKISFRFSSEYTAWSAARAQAQYSKVPISKIENGCERPLIIEYDTALTIALAEAELVDYARMKFEPDSSDGIAIRSRLGGEVHKKLPFQSPWRVVMIGKSPGDILEKNYLLLNLNDPSVIKDDSWIKPGKVLREVTLTTTGAKAAVDFISAHKMQYIEFDAGWYGPENNDLSDARAVNIDPARSKGPLDLPEIINYAHSRNIGVLLYVNRKALEKQLDDLLPIYSNWGISGIKFGFVQVGTQPVTAWMLDVHDEYRPTGFSRTYPNFLTQEGIRGDEESPTNGHTLITMFTRAIAGPADNTVCYYDNRVDAKMGSHASQLAKAVCIFSPLQFLYWYDKPIPAGREDEMGGKPNYLGNEPELEFFDNLPTIWDDTKVLYGKIGEYGIIAREKGDEWFIGGINGEKAKDFNLKFSFLTPGIKYIAKIYSDDASVNTRTHVRIDTVEINNQSQYIARLGSNRGIAMHVIPKK
jgi:alpha-glucosidase